MILIIGHEEEAHAAFIYDKILKAGEGATYFDTRAFPTVSRLAFHPDSAADGFFQAAEHAPKIPLTDIHSVYWRYFMGVSTDHIEDPFLKEMASREIQSSIGSLFRGLDQALWINSPDAIEQHFYKGYQLKLLTEAGIRVPRTLVTNDPEALRGFYEALNRQVIYKPVAGGAHTEKLKPQDLKPERLKELPKAPVQFQEFIPGVDIRVYVIGKDLFSAEIQAETLDFRNDPGAPIVPVELPEKIIQDCFTVAKTLGLVFTGIDIRRTPEGEYVFLEGNPSPMFIYFEKVSGFPISDRLVSLLCHKPSKE